MTTVVVATFLPIRVRAAAKGWVVEDHRRWRSRSYHSRRDALHAAQAFAKRDRKDVVVHNQNGDIEQILTFDSLSFRPWRRKAKAGRVDAPKSAA